MSACYPAGQHISFPYHLRHGHKLKSSLLVFADDPVSGDDGVFAVGAHVVKAAVMHQDDVAANDLPLRMAFDAVGGSLLPVPTGDRPHDRRVSQLAGAAQS